MNMFKLMAILLNNSRPYLTPKMVMTFILDVDLDLEIQGHSHLIPPVEIAYKIYIIHMVLNKFNQIIVENYLHIRSKC